MVEIPQEKKERLPEIIKRTPRPIPKEKGDLKGSHILLGSIIIATAILLFSPLINFAILETDALSLNYQISDEDVATNLEFYGYLDTTGGWFILKYDLVNGSLKYIRGGDNYNATWLNRSILDYSPYDEVFP